VAGSYVISLGLLAVSIVALAQAHTAIDAAPALLMMIFLAALVVGVQIAMRGTLGRPAAGGTPLEMLAAQERRHAGRRRLIWMLPRFLGLLFVFAVGIEIASMIAARRFDLPGTLAVLAAFAVTAWFVRAVTTRVARIIERDRREAAEVRRLLDSDDGSD
jgi:hypothetical protein